MTAGTPAIIFIFQATKKVHRVLLWPSQLPFASISLGREATPVHPKGNQVLGVPWKDWCWSWNSNTLATWCKELTYLKRPWCWERLRAGGEGDNRRWDGWMALPTQWTWVWVDPGVGDGQGGLACCDSWGHKESDTTEQLNWTELNWKLNSECFAFPFFFILCSYSCIWHIIICLHYVFIFIVMSTRGCESDAIFKTVNSWRDDLWEMSSDALCVGYWLAHFEALQLPWSFHFVWLST